MMKIIGVLFLGLWAFEVQSAVSFIVNNDRVSFVDSKQSYNCPGGWSLAAGKCVKNSCSAEIYPLDTPPDAAAGVVIRCQSGNDISFGYSSCNSGWVLLAAKCEQQMCEGYPFASIPDASIGTVDAETCKSGGDTKYKYASCKTGWDFNDGACEVHNCDSSIYLTSVCINNAICATCYTGGSVRYASPVCKSGYELSDGLCVEKVGCSGGMLSLQNYWCGGALQCLLK